MPSLSVPPDHSAPSIARAFAASWLRAWGLEQLSDSVLLAMSELVTNAVVHVGLPLEVRLDVDERAVRLEVQDQARTPPVSQRSRSHEQSGHGLPILEHVSDEWGTTPIPGDGKSVWCCFHTSGT